MFTTQSTKLLTCTDCGAEFQFSTSEQQFYADRGFSEPRRCPACRASRKAARGEGLGATPNRASGTRELFAATCASCGREAQVPFRPTGSRPVYCSDCFRSQPRGW
jgi:CxxC-x17-CxxC domain-containing protein